MMTKKHAATLLILMLVGLTGLVNAQMSPLIKAQIPFDFVANGKKLPAGECIIAVVTNGLTKLTIRSGKQAVLALPIADEWPNANTETALVFLPIRRPLLPDWYQTRKREQLPIAGAQQAPRT